MKCLQTATKELNESAVYTDREIEIDHDTKDVPGSPHIADTIYKKIQESDLFIADVTPVAETKTGKKIMNPNVAIETGYATAILGDKKIRSIMNSAYGSMEDLPFDLRHKKGPVTFALNEKHTEEEKQKVKSELIRNLKAVLKHHTGNKAQEKEDINLDVNGKAIFFDPNEPLLRISKDGWSAVKDQKCFFHKRDAYYFIKMAPILDLKFKKTELKAKMFTGNRFIIQPMFASPSNTPDINKHGAVVVNFEQNSNGSIEDLAQAMCNGVVIGLSNSRLKYSKGSIYLRDTDAKLKQFLKQYREFAKELGIEPDIDVKVEFGISTEKELTITRPNPAEKNSYYPEPEVGPIESGVYGVSGQYTINNLDTAGKDLMQKFTESLFDEIDIEFDYDYHMWDSI